ncbi:MAG: hypothetical protein QOE09_3119 [Ilumatobacteraceae bacterium]
MKLQPDIDKFFDPDVGPGSGLHIVLRHGDDEAAEQWYMERRIAYRDRHFDKPICVPRDRVTFVTDLTSVPLLFTWLVPRTGNHLAAALVHDALTPPFSVVDKPDWDGPDKVTQLQADRVFRDAMGDLGTPLLRRWLVWSAVSIPTARLVNKVRGHLAYASIAAIVVLGWFATLDLFDQGKWLPWMGDRPWTRELLFGGLMAIAIPVVLALLWPKGLRTAGLVVGIAVAALLHVTVAVAAISAAYQLLEHGAHVWDPPRRTMKLGLTLLAIGVIVLTIWMCKRY